MNRKWTANDIPDQAGRIAVVTGANSGIGFEAARALARRAATVVLACRDPAKGEAAARAIRDQVPASTMRVMALDLADLDAVRGFAAAFRAAYDRLDLLINNAGVMMLPRRLTTAQGFEMQFGTNHLGHFALTGLLLELLLATPGARVVSVSSEAHRFGAINFADLQSAGSYTPWRAYGGSKLANLLFTRELARRLEAAGAEALAAAAHPGWAATNLQRHMPIARFLNPHLAQTPAMGALPVLYAATSPEAANGAYYGPTGFLGLRGHPGKAHSNGRSNDADSAVRLWAASEALTSVRFPV